MSGQSMYDNLTRLWLRDDYSEHWIRNLFGPSGQSP